MFILHFLLITLVVSSEILSQDSIAVTIYNDDFAIVKDIRDIKFDKGDSRLYFTDVAENILKLLHSRHSIIRSLYEFMNKILEEFNYPRWINQTIHRKIN